MSITQKKFVESIFYKPSIEGITVKEVRIFPENSRKNLFFFQKNLYFLLFKR